jgi:DNA-binding NarL/FixJ family response regulator
LLESDFELVGTVTDGRSLITAVRDRHPDVILLDISMPVLNGLEAARQICTEAPAAKMSFVTVHSDTPYVIEGFRARCFRPRVEALRGVRNS